MFCQATIADAHAASHTKAHADGVGNHVDGILIVQVNQGEAYPSQAHSQKVGLRRES